MSFIKLKGQYVKIKGSPKWHAIVDISDSGVSAHKGGGNHYTVVDEDGNTKKVHQDHIVSHAFGEDIVPFKKTSGITIDKMNHFEGSNLSPTEHHYSINKDGSAIGRAIVFENDPKSIHEPGRTGASLKDIRLNPEHHGKGYSKQVIDQLTSVHGPLSSDSRGNISQAGANMFSAYGQKAKDSKGVDHYVLGAPDAK